jgi:predicted HD phosphohydrolase
VQAKRYLTFKDSHYFEQLSEASRQTLRQQGGRMTAEEAETFENHPLFGLMVNLRLWDEAAKIVDQPRPDLNHYEAMCLRHVQNNLVAAPPHSSPL